VSVWLTVDAVTCIKQKSEVSRLWVYIYPLEYWLSRRRHHPWCYGKEFYLMIKEGDFVIRTANTVWKPEGFLWHPLSFGQVIEFIKCDHETRPTATDGPAEWTEIAIRPFDNRMAPDGAWIQWVEEECIVIRPWVYCLLGLFWPLLRLVYTKPLQGQRTEYKLFR